MYFLRSVTIVFLLLTGTNLSFSQSKFTDNKGQLNYSDFDSWYVRKVEESSLLSGKTIDLFGVGKVDSNADLYDTRLKDNNSPWSTTNIYAKMVLDIGNTRVYPEKRVDGYCMRLESAIRKDNIAGIKVNVLLSGTLFLGEMIEPVKGMKDPVKNCSQGVPFNRHPKAVKFDYKYIAGKNRVKATNKITPASGPDLCEFCLILQKRWEDKDGNVFATRIGGARQFYTGSVKEWVNGATYQIRYGDITQLPEYDEKTMGLIPGVSEVWVKNSKGKLVSLTETGWGKETDMPTHIIMYFTSSYRGIEYVGSTESVMWVDNFEFVY